MAQRMSTNGKRPPKRSCSVTIDVRQIRKKAVTKFGDCLGIRDNKAMKFVRSSSVFNFVKSLIYLFLFFSCDFPNSLVVVFLFFLNLFESPFLHPAS